MATEPEQPKDTTDNKDDVHLGQPIDRKGKALSDDQAKIFNRYNAWKNNLMCLYNHIECYALPYPARTVQFLPNPKQTVSPKNQYERYTNCPFIYPSHCTVPKQDRSASAQTADPLHNKSTSSNPDYRYTESRNIRSTNPCTVSFHSELPLSQ